MSDPNQNPFAAYSAAAAAARPAPAPASAGAPAPAAVANPGGFGGASLEWGGNENDPNSKTVRLRDRLNEADTERRKDEEAALRRERAAEIRREERQRKIKYMMDMPDSQPAGTGTLRPRFVRLSRYCVLVSESVVEGHAFALILDILISKD
jgi:hypothetical protein